MAFYTQSPVRASKMADSLFVQKTDGMVQTATRDLAQLADYGVGTETLDAIVAKRNEFAYLPTDYMLSGAMMMATQARNDKHKELERSIRRIADRVRLKFGEGHGMYAALGVAMLSKQPAHELVRTGRSVVATCTQYLAQLASEGVTVQLLADITTMSTELDELIDAKIQAVKNRDLAAFTRICVGNELYAMVINLAGKGKSCWYGINEAKYNDYIMYTNNESPSKQTIDGNIDAGMVVNASVSVSAGSTVITMHNRGTAPLHFFFAEDPTDSSAAYEVLVPPSERLSHSATQLGYSPETKRFNVYNPSDQEGSYVLEW